MPAQRKAVDDTMEKLSIDEDTTSEMPRERKYSGVNRVHEMIRERQDSCVEESVKFEVAKVKCLKEIYENFLIEEKQRSPCRSICIERKNVKIGEKVADLEKTELAVEDINCDEKPTEKIKIVESKGSIKEKIKNFDETEITSPSRDTKDDISLPDDHNSSFKIKRESIKKQLEQGNMCSQIERKSRQLKESQKVNVTVDKNVVKDVETESTELNLSGKNVKSE